MLQRGRQCAGRTRTPPNPVQQGTVDERLAITAEPHDQQDVEAVDQVQTKAEGMIEGGDEEDLFSKIFADAENYDWTESYKSRQDEGPKGPTGKEGESDDEDAPLSKDLSPNSDFGEGQQGPNGREDEESDNKATETATYHMADTTGNGRLARVP